MSHGNSPPHWSGGMPRQDDKPGPACCRHLMEWSITAGLVVGFLALVADFVSRTECHDAGSAPGRFDFDRYKEGELSQRGHS